MRILSFSVIILLFVLFLLFSILKLPGEFYLQSLSSGSKNTFYQIEKVNQSIINPLKKVRIEEDMKDANQNKWKDFHLFNYVIPFPIRHPHFKMVPLLEYVSKRDSTIGFRILDRKNNELLEAKILKEQLYPRYFKDKIFNLPFFNSKFSKISFLKVWEDAFSKKLYTSKTKEEYSIGNLLKLPQLILFDIAYNLYLLKLRKNLIGEGEVKGVYLLNDMGVVQLKVKEEVRKAKKEVVLIARDDVLYRLELTSKVDEIAAVNLYYTILNGLKIKKSDKDSSVAIYSEYNILPYSEKIDEKGMAYLFAAWTHDQSRKEFLTEMVYFLERGEGNFLSKSEVYEYAYKKFGSNFSNDLNKLKETSGNKLKRKISEEKARELYEAARLKGEIPDDFINNKFKIKFHLQRAKDLGVNKDDDRKTLIGD